MMKTAILRDVSGSLGRCELTHVARQPIDVEVARAQHAAYARALAELGCRVVTLPEEPDLPDAVFVEDTAMVLPEIAIITRPGAPSRRAECASVRATLARYRVCREIQEPGTIDGGDVLVAGRDVYIGASSRTNGEAIGQVANLLHAWGYRVHEVPLSGCLHLKSAVTLCAEEALLVNPAWVDPARFNTRAVVEVDPSEPYGANGLWVGGTLLYPTAFPRTRKRLEARGTTVRTIDLSELAKAEGAVTCCSLVFDP